MFPEGLTSLPSENIDKLFPTVIGIESQRLAAHCAALLIGIEPQRLAAHCAALPIGIEPQRWRLGSSPSAGDWDRVPAPSSLLIGIEPQKTS